MIEIATGGYIKERSFFWPEKGAIAWVLVEQLITNYSRNMEKSTSVFPASITSRY
ncbi:MAG: hypothetical protein F6K17_34675 [Okeania sp. SIO3C4]|nr:hypothetical protein [Okeania sp. SIO3C4]